MMTAGKSATAKPTDGDRREGHLPHSPLELARGKRDRREIFVFQSPKNGRTVTVADLVNFCQALMLEFDPQVEMYVERPRRITVGEKRNLELSFWVGRRDGTQHYQFVIPTKRVASLSVGLVKLPADDELIHMALNQGLVLRLVHENSLASRASEVAVAYELLPLVWANAKIAGARQLEVRIEDMLQNVERLTMSALQLQTGQARFAVACAVASLVYTGRVQLVDYRPGDPDALVEVRHG